MQFDWDTGNWPKCGQHGVGKNEIEFVLSSQPLMRRDIKHSGKEPRFHAIGRNQNDRFVFIVFCVRGGAMRPISARYMHLREVEGITHV